MPRKMPENAQTPRQLLHALLRRWLDNSFALGMCKVIISLPFVYQILLSICGQL